MPKTILVVDDSKPVRAELRRMLQGAGYEIVEAENGQAGTVSVACRPRFDLIILDVNMPLVNGIDMLKNIKRRNLAPGVPILMLTTEGLDTLIEEAKNAGASGWMWKPFKPENLLAAVNKLAGGS